LRIGANRLEVRGCDANLRVPEIRTDANPVLRHGRHAVQADEKEKCGEEKPGDKPHAVRDPSSVSRAERIGPMVSFTFLISDPAGKAQRLTTILLRCPEFVLVFAVVRNK